MKPFIVIDLPLAPHFQSSGDDATFYLTMPFVLCEYKADKNMSILNDGVHNNGGWRIALPLKELKQRIKEALDE